MASIHLQHLGRLEEIGGSKKSVPYKCGSFSTEKHDSGEKKYISHYSINAFL